MVRENSGIEGWDFLDEEANPEQPYLWSLINILDSTYIKEVVDWSENLGNLLTLWFYFYSFKDFFPSAVFEVWF